MCDKKIISFNVSGYPWMCSNASFGVIFCNLFEIINQIMVEIAKLTRKEMKKGIIENI